jgi:thimet oligopeptidase
VTLTLRDFHRAGVDTDEKTRARLKDLADQEQALQLDFERNINDDAKKIEVTRAELDGLPADYIALHPPGPDGKIWLSTDYPDSIPLKQFSRSTDARKRMHTAFLTRGFPKNDEVLRKLLTVRAEEARLLGYASYADYITEDKMIHSAKNAQDFIDKIASVSEASARRDVAALLARKKKDDPTATTIYDYEHSYYGELVNREQVGFDAQSVRPYFDFAPTRDGLLQLTSQLFGVEYRAVADAPRWSPEVDVYDVYQAGEKLGRIYLDLHPRANKFKHAACFAWVPGVAGGQLPEAALVTNLPDPHGGGVALMTHADVVVLFHEFGHLMHDLVSGRQRWVTFSGQTVFDFVEAPSQMFEEWASDPSTLALFARHYQTHEPMPPALIARMRAADEFGKGIDARIQMFYAAFSLRAHQLDPATADFTALVREMQNKYSPFAYVDGTHLEASFGHITEYSAMYYTYMWSLVIAKDLLSEFKKHGLLDADTSRRYRESILVPGNAREADESIRIFLGRPYSFESFRRWLDG